jgi:tetratricopeptide (TPR) repeat protein
MGRCGLALAIVTLFVGATAEAQQDVRERYAVRDLAAAQAIARGMALMDAGKKKESLAEMESAIRRDPKCGFAYFQKGMLLVDTGDIDKAVECFGKAAEYCGPGMDLGIQAAINAGLLLAQTGKIDESNVWLSRAILLDPTDRSARRWVPLRNMGINARTQKRYVASLLLLIQAYEKNEKEVSKELIKEVAEEADNEQTEAVCFMHFGAQPAKPRPAFTMPPLEALPVSGTIDEIVNQVLPDPNGRFLLAFSARADHYFHVDLKQARPVVKKVDLRRKVDAACLVGDSLYLALEDPMSVCAVEAATGRIIRHTPFKGASAPTSLAVAPSRELSLLVIGRRVHSLTDAGELEATSF